VLSRIKATIDARERGLTHPTPFEELAIHRDRRIKPLDPERPGVGVHHHRPVTDGLQQGIHQLGLPVDDLHAPHGFFDGVAKPDDFHVGS
jgi:hypothetical protein